MADHARAAYAAFSLMRENLLARGLLDSEYRLTAAGHAYVDDIIAERKAAIARRSSSCPERWAA